QRGEHDPRGDGAIVRAERGPSGNVVEELAFDSVHHSSRPAGTVAGREPPAVLPVAFELHRVVHRVRLLHEGRLTAVLEIVAVMLTHENVAEAPEVNPQMRELVGE